MASSTGKTIAVTTLAQTGLRIVEIVIGVIMLAMITRYLSPAGFGHFTTVNALLQFFVTLVDFGLYLTLLREISAHEDRMGAISNNIFTIRLISSAALLVIALILIQFSPYDSVTKLGATLLAVSYLSASLVSTVTAVFQKQLRMVSIGVINVFNKCASVVAMYLIVTRDWGLQSIFITFSLIGVLTFFAAWYMLSRLPNPVHLRLAFDTAYWREVMHKTWPIAVTIALNLVYFRADTIILSLTQSQESVGIYGAAYRVLEILTAFPHMFMGLILPLLTAAWVARDVARLQTVWERAFIFFAALTIPIVVGGMMLGKKIMVFVAGDTFSASGPVLGVLMLATAAIFFGTLYTYVVLVIEKQKKMIKFFFATAVVSLIGYVLAIPRFNYWGAAWMTVLSELMIVASAWFVIHDTIHLQIPWSALFKICIASAGMAITIWLIAPFMPVLFVTAIGFICYCALAYLLRTVHPDELKLLITG